MLKLCTVTTMVMAQTTFDALLSQCSRSFKYATTKGIRVNWEIVDQSVRKMATKGGECLPCQPHLHMSFLNWFLADLVAIVCRHAISVNLIQHWMRWKSFVLHVVNIQSQKEFCSITMGMVCLGQLLMVKFGSSIRSIFFLLSS